MSSDPYEEENFLECSFFTGIGTEREVQPSTDSIFKQSTPVFPDMNCLNYELYQSMS
jgi:hypothetical protein